MVAIINGGSTLTYTDATASSGTTYNYLLIPFTWDGNALDSTYNYDTASAPSISASIGNGLSAPTVVATQPTCTSTGSILVTSPSTGVSYSFNNGSSFQAIDSIGSLAPTTDTTYEVSVKDSASGCVSQDTAVALNEAPAAPGVPTALATSQPTCIVPTGTITVTAPATGVTYSFNNGSTFQAADSSSGLASGTYQVSVDSSGCISPPTSVLINPVPSATFTVSASNDTITLGSSATLIGSVSEAGTYTYLWTDPTSVAINNADSLVASSSPTVTTNYTLIVTDSNGCFATGLATVVVQNNLPCLNIRNAFTPNGDGIDELWLIYDNNSCFINAEVDVYNRWGSPVYHSDSYANTWDGTYKGHELPDATYYYVIKVTLTGGGTQILTGNVVIIR